jgi:Cu(I)/Ag(I) efflux system membrane fusion protein
MYGSAVVHAGGTAAAASEHAGHDHQAHEASPPVAGPSDESAVLAVPSSAVLDTGTRAVVYVQKDDGTFAAAPVTVGPRAGDWVPILAGLSEGQQVVAEGNLLIDSPFQIQGLPSLFNAEGGSAPAPKHQH